MDEDKKRKLVIDGNAFYELDLECIRQKEKKQENIKKRQQQKGQRK